MYCLMVNVSETTFSHYFCLFSFNDIVFCEAADATRSIGGRGTCSSAAKRRAFTSQRGSFCGGSSHGGGAVFSPPANAR